MNSHRQGFSIVVVIVTLALLEIASLGIAAVCVRANVTARASTDLVRARIAAESAVRFALAEWDEVGIGYPVAGSLTIIPWVPSPVPGITLQTLAERTFRGVYVVRAEAAVLRGGSVRARTSAAVTVSSLPTGEVWFDFHSAVVSAGDLNLLAGAIVDASDPATSPAPWTASDCVPAGPAVAHMSASPRPAVALGAGATLMTAPTAALAGSPATWSRASRTAAADFQRWGTLRLVDLLDVADHVISGSTSPRPATASGLCDTTDPVNWGAPSDRAHPCFDYFPLIYADSDLNVTSGEGQGILIVDGDLNLASGTRFHGPILATGRIHTARAEIHGAVRVGGSGSSIDGLVRFDQCALLRAIERSPPLRRVYRAGDRLWLPPF